MILGLDTATQATAVALWSPARAVEARDDPPPGARPRHTTRLMALIAEVLEEAGGDWEQVERIAVGVGPGTFTGLRIGVATARALAAARGLPLVGVSTLQSLALGAEGATERGIVLPVLDARRREVFAAAWPAGAELTTAPGEPLLAPLAIAPAALAERIPELGLPALAIGDGAIQWRDALERAGACVPEDGSPLHRVSAIEHCRLAAHRQPSDPAEVAPEYLRLPDAEIAHRSAAAPS